MVTRSALALKLLTSAKHASVLAAATFGLPEATGAGSLNWDYRATWIRDAAFTVSALMRLGYRAEATAFRHWIGARANDDGSLQVLYSFDGSEYAEEEELPHLRGYAGARPVRIGNAAHTQFQLDIYGELLDAVYLGNKYGEAISNDGWRHVTRTVDYVCEHWQEPDQGIWEMRGPAQHWLHSRLMCWVAVDRAMRLALKRSLPAPIPCWHEVRDAIRASVWDEFWDERRGHFVAAKGATHLEGAMLLMPLVRFISATDPCWLATLGAIEQELVEDPLVYRYRTINGLNVHEGAFTACSFWYAECLARAGRPCRGATRVRKNAELCQSAGPVFRGDGPLWRAPRQHAAGIDAPCPD
jgi:GH15 family glucan-1,4-alpha-glucosidase